MLNPVVKWGVAAAAVAWAGVAGAAPINGSLTIGAAGITPDPGALDAVTSFAAPTGGFFSIGAGSFTNLTSGGSTLNQLLTFTPNPVVIPAGTGSGTSALTVVGSGAASGFGTFTSSSVQVVARTTGFLDLFFLGTYTPNFGPSGTGGTLYDANEPGSLRLGLTRTGTSVSFSGTLAVPPSPPSVPEPASMALLGTGLLGLGLARRRKAN